MKKTYFRRVTEQTPTRFWINNPSRAEVDLSICEGAVGCTCNPSYCGKMLERQEEREYVINNIDEIIKNVDDDTKVHEILQRKIIKPIADKFMPIFENTNHKQGYVSIQGDPLNENVENIVQSARENSKVGKNILCKVPATADGLKAIEMLLAEGISINVTECFAIQQIVCVCEIYKKYCFRKSSPPKIFISHIAGIYEDYLKEFVEKSGIQIERDILEQSGLAIARKAYKLIKERYPDVGFVGGGARNIHHFTEMVGGDVNVTINWRKTADLLLELDPPVIYRIFNPVESYVIEELNEKLPDFRVGYMEDGLEPEGFEDFGPVVKFRSSFINDWKKTLEAIHNRRIG